MARQNTGRIRCPECHASIKSLYYISHQSISGEFTLATGHEDNLEPDLDGIEYCCPECGKGLFDKEGAAEAFLLGRGRDRCCWSRNGSGALGTVRRRSVRTAATPVRGAPDL